MKLRDRIPALSYDRPVTVLMTFLALLVLGLIAYSRIPVQMLPSGFQPNFLFAIVNYRGSAPLETDDRIVRPVEEQLSTVPGISRLRTSASASNATFLFQFYGSTAMTEAYNDVIDRFERAMPDLPEDVERYTVISFNPEDQPILWVGVSLPEEVQDPNHVMRRVVTPRLERLPGVAAVAVHGADAYGVSIDYDRDKLFAHAVDVGGLQRRLMTDNFQIGSGRLIERGLVRPIRGLSTFTRADLPSYPVRDSLVLADIADINLGGEESEDLFRLDGEKGAALAIGMESGGNTVEVARRVRAELLLLQDDPRVEGARFHVLFDQGELITDGVDTLLNSALVGGFFAVLVLYAFLREWRMTLLIAASIPVSLLLTVGGLYFAGHDLNLLSLMGLMLAVGMVVDNAIVVVETIYRRRAEGAGVRDSAISGTGEVNLAIVASTTTTMVVFLPVMLMSENALFSTFMTVMGLPVVLALAASLLVALVFSPLATRFMGTAAIRPDPFWLVWLARGYQRVLRFVLSRRADTVMAMLAAAVLTFTVAVPGVQCSGGIAAMSGDFLVRFNVPAQAGPSERQAILERFEQVFESHREDWGVRVIRSEIRASQSRGSLMVYLEPDGPMDKQEIIAAARNALPTDMPGVKGVIGWEGGQNMGNSVTLEVDGEDMVQLLALGDEVKRRVENLEGVLGAEIGQQTDGADEIQLQLSREALARYGVGAQQVGQTVSYAMRGMPLQPLKEGEREIDLSSGFSLEDRSDVNTILNFEIFSPARMAFVPIRVLTDVVFTKGPVAIERVNRRTSVSVTLDLEQDVVASEVYPRIDAALEDMAFPRGTSWSKGSDFKVQIENDNALMLAMLLSVCFVFLLMGTLFESWVLPLGIITTIPMALFGSMWGLYLSGTPMDTMAGVGLVILVGVIVNNGIVLVDLVTQLREEGMERTEALIEAGGRRLRPILMTALTTICGMLPMALGTSAFIGIPYAPLGRTVISGLAVGTVLTLILVPFLYAWLDDFAAGVRQWAGYVGRGATAWAGMRAKVEETT